MASKRLPLMAQELRKVTLQAAMCLLVLLISTSAVRAGGPPPPVPEIDPGSVGSALTLLAGGVLLLTGRRLRK